MRTYSKMTIAAVVLALLSVGTATTGQAQLATLSLGFAYEEDFDAGDGGWTASPVPPPAARLHPIGSWEWGTPTSGPGFAASGSNVWATNLDGDYGPRECAAILSPPITIPAGADASVALKHWMHSERSTATFGLQDGGRLFVTPDGGDTLYPLDPHQPYDGAFSTDARRCHDDLASGSLGIGGPVGTAPPSAVYNTLSADLSAYAGQAIQVAVSFASTSTNHRAGWYIDDFAVTIGEVTSTEDFEASDGGFALISTRKHPGPPKGWNYGEVTAGPPAESPMWATNTAGDYGHFECASLDSPKFRVGSDDLGTINEVLGGAGVMSTSAILRWRHWFRSNSIYAAGLVLIGTDEGYEVLTPDQGYPATITTSNLDAQAGLLECLDVDVSQRVFSGSHQSTTAPLADFSANLTPWVGEEVSLRFLFASAWTPLNPSTGRGWYVDDVSVELVGQVHGPNPQDVIDDLVPDPDQPMHPAWDSGGVNNSWEWGVATSGPEGELVLGTNLDGEHNAGECSFVTSPAVPGALLQMDSDLTFDHWYSIASTSTNTGWSGGVVLVSGDLGASWQYLDLPGYTRAAQFSPLQGCLASHGLAGNSRVFSGSKATFNRVTADLSAYRNSPTVQVRFLFGSYTALTEEGWHLRSVDIAGLKVL